MTRILFLQSNLGFNPDLYLQNGCDTQTKKKAREDRPIRKPRRYAATKAVEPQVDRDERRGGRAPRRGRPRRRRDPARLLGQREGACARDQAADHAAVDPEVIRFFKRTGKGYQSRMRAVLQSYVEANKGRR